MLNKSDLKAIRDILNDALNSLREEFIERFADKNDLKRFALKDDLVSFKDEILGEIKSLREEVTIVTGYKNQIEDHEVRIEKLEKTIQS